MELKWAINRGRLCFFFLVLLSSLYSCEKDDGPQDIKKEDPLELQKRFAYDILTDIYYWYRYIPSGVEPSGVDGIHEYFDTLLAPQDRWSWMMTGQEYLDSESGIAESYGISLGQPIEYYNDYSVKVRYVHPGSPMDDMGIKRGYTLTHLNGVPVSSLIANGSFNAVYSGSTNNFTFLDHSGLQTNFTVTKEIINTRSSLMATIYDNKDYPGLPGKIGYFHYLSFKASMLDDIKEAMNLFKTNNISELILDLRYNGGGDSRATKLLANYIAPASAQGALLARREHNDRYSSWDQDKATQTIIEREADALDLNRIFILTTKGTASASEIIINGLRPLVEVIQIGETTYGKPNGMYVLPYPDGNYDNPEYVFLPICYFSVNSEGEGHYVDGLVPDHIRPDDLYHDFGLRDDWIQSIFKYITEGKFPALPSRESAVSTLSAPGKIIREEDMAQYGRYSVIPLNSDYFPKPARSK
jgi:C-terminal processing protease CtpA/Prc